MKSHCRSPVSEIIATDMEVAPIPASHHLAVWKRTVPIPHLPGCPPAPGDTCLSGHIPPTNTTLAQISAIHEQEFKICWLCCWYLLFWVNDFTTFLTDSHFDLTAVSFVLYSYLELNLIKSSITSQILTQSNTLLYFRYARTQHLKSRWEPTGQSGTPQPQLGPSSAKCLEDGEWRGHTVILNFFISSESECVIIKANEAGVPWSPPWSCRIPVVSRTSLATLINLLPIL